MNLNSTEKREIRKFGAIAFVFFGSLSGLGLWMDKTLAACFFGPLAVLGLAFVLMPGPLRPVHSAWMRVAHFLGRVMTTLILALAYYIVITPAAMIKRVFGGAPISVKPDKNVSSYWVTRTEPVQPRERFIKRY